LSVNGDSFHMGVGLRKRVLILGGGFGGIYTALELEKALSHHPYVEVTLVNRENFFLSTPMLHEVAASDLDITHIVNPIRKLLRKVKFFHGEVEAIHLPSDDMRLAEAGIEWDPLHGVKVNEYLQCISNSTV
jgi:NADH:ubiquinone reductase (H+-translocating)